MATPAGETKEDTLETRSRYSGSACSSQLTSSSVAAAKACVKAEAARLQLSFAQRNADILKQQAEQLKKKADVDGDMHVLKSQKATAAVLAEVQAWKHLHKKAETHNSPNWTRCHILSRLNEQYVQQHTELDFDLQTPQVNPLEPISSSVLKPDMDIEVSVG